MWPGESDGSGLRTYPTTTERDIAAKGIVRALVGRAAPTAEDNDDRLYCCLCNRLLDDDIDGWVHAIDCPWRSAVEWVAAETS